MEANTSEMIMQSLPRDSVITHVGEPFMDNRKWYFHVQYMWDGELRRTRLSMHFSKKIVSKFKEKKDIKINYLSFL